VPRAGGGAGKPRGRTDVGKDIPYSSRGTGSWLQRTGICKALLRPAAASPMLLLIDAVDAVDAVGTSDLPRVRYVVAERTVVGNPQ